MATSITLTAQNNEGKNMRMRVSQTPEQVGEAWAAAGGQPFQLTADRGGDVWVNPSSVVCWQEARAPGGAD
jgi:hypothetical protein